LREHHLVDLLNPEIDNAAAGQAYFKGVVVAHAIPLQSGRSGRDRLLAQFVDRALDASARDAANGRAVRANEHDRAGGSGGTAPGPDHRGHAHRLALPPPARELRQHVAHWTTSSLPW